MEHLSTFKRTRIKASKYYFIKDGKVNTNYPIGYNYALGYCEKNRAQQPVDVSILEINSPYTQF